jgi:small subunit ribosomal protein S21
MLIIRPDKNDNIERMLKKFKVKFLKTGILNELRDRQQFEKPSVKKRKMKKKAIYRSKLQHRQDNE